MLALTASLIDNVDLLALDTLVYRFIHTHPAPSTRPHRVVQHLTENVGNSDLKKLLTEAAVNNPHIPNIINIATRCVCVLQLAMAAYTYMASVYSSRKEDPRLRNYSVQLTNSEHLLPFYTVSVNVYMYLTLPHHYPPQSGYQDPPLSHGITGRGGV